MNNKGMVVFAWGLSLLVAGLAVAGWLSDYQPKFEDLNVYLVFPLLGLLAFSLMWVHYVVGAARRVAGVEKEPLAAYFKATGWVALICIVLHPSLLIWELWRVGAGLPPGSYLAYVGPTMKWAATFGTLAFLIFLSFEGKRRFENRGWWTVIEYAQVVAMFAIVYHSLALGSNLQTGWFRFVWLWYALSLVLAVAYIYYVDIKQAREEGALMKKVIGILVVVLLVTGGAVYAYKQLNKDEPTPASTSSSSEQPSEDEAVVEESFTVEEIKDHNNKEDCWTIVSGSVYDITAFIARHPGGDEILRACGEDATTMFTSRQDESGDAIGSGTPHSSSAASQLEQFKIGIIQQ